MKAFKKIIKGAAIIIGVLLLILVGVLIYRNLTSYKHVIHKDADAIVKIRVDAIKRSVIWDAIKHPMYYYRFQKDQDSIDDYLKGKGFTIPANIFLYTIKGKNMSTVFTSFKITNTEDFKLFLRKEFKMKETSNIEGMRVAKTDDEKMLAAFTDDQCVLVYNPKKEPVDSIFKDILLDRKTLSDSDSLFNMVRDANSDNFHYFRRRNFYKIFLQAWRLLKDICQYPKTY